jgi:hypothetical protein
MARVHVCSEPGCPQLEPCPVHGRRDQKRQGWHHRDGDRAAHMRWRRKAIKAQSSCQMCGSTDKLDVHHDEHGNPVVLCNLHHVTIDPHARAR